MSIVDQAVRLRKSPWRSRSRPMSRIWAGISRRGRAAPDAAPVTANLSAFYISVNEVTISQWQAVCFWAKDNGYTDLPEGTGKAPNHPVYFVNWYDVVKWCNARSQMEGLTPCYELGHTYYKTDENPNVECNWNANGYRLPTEAEWEKAARGGLVGQRFPWGNTITHNLANYNADTTTYSYDLGPDGYHPLGVDDTYPYTIPVGTFAANGYGLHDVAGNAFEWCWDWYGTPFAGGSDPRGPSSGLERVARGGSWNYAVSTCRVGYRFYRSPTAFQYYFGFRPARRAVP